MISTNSSNVSCSLVAFASAFSRRLKELESKRSGPATCQNGLGFQRTIFPATRSKAIMTDGPGARSQTSLSTAGQVVKTSARKNSTLICASLTASSIDGQLQEMQIAEAAGADIAEIRVDLIDIEERHRWKDIFERRCIPVIVTNRARWEGGNAVENENERVQVLVEAEKIGAEYVDVELEAASLFQSLREKFGSGKCRGTELILSHHNFQKALSLQDVESVLDAMCANGADICKIAMMATAATDNATVFETLRMAQKPTIMVAMGELGQVSRIACAKYGAFLTFASVGSGRESAPGQVDAKTLVDFYRFRQISKDTPFFGIIGNPVEHSMSPALHNGAMAHLNLDGVYVYLKVEKDIPGFIRHMSGLGFAGFSVTIPGKVVAIEALDLIDDVAKQIGAINTVVRTADGKLKGYNTDWSAAISAIENAISSKSFSGLNVVCLGAGGAGRALAFGALARGARSVVIVNRTKEKALALVRDLNSSKAFALSLEEFIKSEDRSFDVIMNTTAVGMHPRINDTPVPGAKLTHKPLVFDAVYNPVETRLVREAAEVGCKVVSGLEMFLGQAAEQFRLWHVDMEPPLVRMRDIVLARLHHKM